MTELELPRSEKEFFELLEATFVTQKPSDDMLFYVKSNHSQLDASERLLVRRWNAQRKDVPTLTAPGGIDWEASYYLNVIVHLAYELEFKVYRKEPVAASAAAAAAALDELPEFTYTELRGKKTPIFASPSRISLDKGDKAHESTLTFPDIYFTLHDHDMHDRGNAPLSRADEFVSIRLTAHGSFLGVDLPSVELFRGVASQAVVFQAYQKVHSAAATPTRRLPFSRSREAPTGHYLALRGPRGKGRAQMSVATSLDADADADADDAAPPTPKAGLVQSLFAGWRRGAEADAPAAAAAAAAPTPLYCSLTFVSIPYDAIVGDCTKAWASKSLPSVAKEH
jgi:hypothetical protein